MSSRHLMILFVVVVLSSLIGWTDAATFTFTFRQATFIVAAVGALYVVLCVIFLIILCRVWDRYSCCHRGKVCPTMAGSNGVIRKGQDFIEIERYSRKKSIMEDKRSRKLESIPESNDKIITNLAALESESLRSSQFSGSSRKGIQQLDTKSSASTTMTSVPPLDDVFDRIPSPTSTTGTATLAEFFEMKAKKESSTSLLDELANETGMFKLLGMKSEQQQQKNSLETKFIDEEASIPGQVVTGPSGKDVRRTPSPQPPSTPTKEKETISKRETVKGIKQPQTTNNGNNGNGKDSFHDEFKPHRHELPSLPVEHSTVIGNPLASDSAQSIASSPVTVAIAPLPPIELKKTEQATIQRLLHIKDSGSPATRSLTDMKDSSSNKSKRSPYGQRVVQTQAYFTPPASAKRRTPTAATDSLKKITVKSKKEKSIDPKPSKEPTRHTKEATLGHQLSNKSSLMPSELKSEVCVVEEADSINELSFI